MHAQRGFSLIEALLTLGLIAGLLVAGVPALQGLLLEARMAARVNALVHGIHAARTLARGRGQPAVVCRSAVTAQCAGAGDWASGWIVFVNADGEEPPQIDGGERIVAREPLVESIRARSNRAAYVLRPWSLRATNGTVVFCDARGAAGARAVVVSTTGRPRVTRRAPGGRPLDCAA